MDLTEGRGSAFILMVACVVLEVGLATATTYTVGDAEGWALNVNYQEWASRHTFTTSDSLLFNYTPPQHSVFEVSEKDYNSCTISNPMGKYFTGSDVVKIKAPDMYFVCGVPNHCSLGMKLAISASTPASTETPSASPSASPNKGAAASLQSASAPFLLVSAFLVVFISSML